MRRGWRRGHLRRLIGRKPARWPAEAARIAAAGKEATAQATEDRAAEQRRAAHGASQSAAQMADRRRRQDSPGAIERGGKGARTGGRGKAPAAQRAANYMLTRWERILAILRDWAPGRGWTRRPRDGAQSSPDSPRRTRPDTDGGTSAEQRQKPAGAHGWAGQARQRQIRKAEPACNILNFYPLAHSEMKIYSGVTNTAKENSEIRISPVRESEYLVFWIRKPESPKPK